MTAREFKEQSLGVAPAPIGGPGRPAALETFCRLGAPREATAKAAEKRIEDTAAWRLGYEAGRAAERDEAARDAEMWRAGEAARIDETRRALEEAYEPGKRLAALSAELASISAMRAEIAVAAERAAADRFAAAFSAIAPRLARDGLAERVADAAAEWCVRVGALEVSCAPETVEEISAALASADVDAPVRADPSLGLLQARAVWTDGVGEIDVDRLLARVTDLLGAPSAPETPQLESNDEQ